MDLGFGIHGLIAILIKASLRLRGTVVNRLALRHNAGARHKAAQPQPNSRSVVSAAWSTAGSQTYAAGMRGFDVTFPGAARHRSGGRARRTD